MPAVAGLGPDRRLYEPPLGVIADAIFRDGDGLWILPVLDQPEVVIAGTIGDLRMAKRQCGLRYVGWWTTLSRDVERDVDGMDGVTGRFSAGGFRKAVSQTALSVDYLSITVIDPASLRSGLR